MAVLNYILIGLNFSTIIYNRRNAKKALYRAFDYIIERCLPKSYIKMRMAILHSSIQRDTISEYFAKDWLENLFVDTFDYPDNCKILDTFLTYGWRSVVKLGIAYIALMESNIISRETAECMFRERV